MYRSILLPLDGSPFGEHAMPLAVGIARRAGAVVQAVHVHLPIGVTPIGHTPAPNMVQRLEAEARQAAQDYMDDIARRLSSLLGTAAQTVVLDGPIVPTLEDFLHRSEADLVVMTTHGRGPVSRAWLGSVADRLVRHASVPVLLIRPEAGDVPPPDQDPEIRNILVPLDGSHLAESVIEHATRLGRLYGARYTLLRVAAPEVAVGYPPAPHGSWVIPDAGESPDADAAREYLEGVADRLRGDGLEVETRVVRHLQPAVAILSAAERDVDVIAMATHGRGGISRAILGSVADKVIRGANVPVLAFNAVAAVR
ncbi:MAG TPA: universal stress protein [Longimicrobiales bacterium]|nr:universal stress protein [Longimicrobiales bacterium]